MSVEEATSVFDRRRRVEQPEPAADGTLGEEPLRRPWNRGTVKITNFPLFLDEHDLEKWLKQYGSVTRTHVWSNKVSGKKSPLAFCEFTDANTARKTAKELDGTMCQGLAVRVVFLPDVDILQSNKLFSHHNRAYKPAKTWQQRAKEAHERYWSIKVEPGTDVADLPPTYREDRFRQSLINDGIKCDWEPFRSAEEALRTLSSL